MRSTLQLALVFLGVSLLNSSPASAEKLLRWKFQPGQALQVNIHQDMQMATSLMGHRMQSRAETELTLDWSVENVDDQGIAEIRQSIERVKMSAQTPGSAPLEFDSQQISPTDEVQQQIAGNIRPILGVGVTQRMSQRGQVMAPDKDSESDAKRDPVGQVLDQGGLQELLNQAATVLPKTPVAPGDTWTGSSEFNSPAGRLTMDTKYTYRGPVESDGRTLEQIDVEIDFGFAKGPNALELDVAVTQQQGQGTILFDAEAGRFVRSNISQRMTLETKLGEQVHRQQLATDLQMTVDERSVRTASASNTTSR